MATGQQVTAMMVFGGRRRRWANVTRFAAGRHADTVGTRLVGCASFLLDGNAPARSSTRRGGAVRVSSGDPSCTPAPTPTVPACPHSPGSLHTLRPADKWSICRRRAIRSSAAGSRYGRRQDIRPGTVVPRAPPPSPDNAPPQPPPL